MSIRYFEIRAPRADFTGRVGGISFADGVARVSFDDTREDDGECLADEHGVQVGRSAVLFAQRRTGYTVVETDASGKPLDHDQGDEHEDEEEEPRKRSSNRRPTTAAATSSKPFPTPADISKKEDVR